MIKIYKNKYLIIVIFVGLILRLAFILFGAELYFGRSNIFIDGDTFMWQKSIENLIEIGTYTLTPEEGRFSRMPGYSFFIGLFYLLFDKNWDIACEVIGWIQTLSDVYCIYLVFLISKKLFKNIKIALISSILYSTYPFIIVWCPVVYSEQLSVLLILLGILNYLKGQKSTKSLICSGFLISIAALTRPQIIPLGLILCLGTLINYNLKIKVRLQKAFIFGLTFILIFGIWPARNYILHNEIVITKKNEGFANWQEDVISFMQYTYAVKTDWDPQYSSIIKNKKTTYPEISYQNKKDSILLEETIDLCKNCGSGFSFKKGYWKKSFYAPNCNKIIENNFNYLREKQIENNPLNFYLWVPLQNLKKAIFKTQLYNTKSFSRKIASLLFYLRSLLIVIGIIGLILIFKKGVHKFSIISMLFFSSIYLVLCFGTKPFMRNIEIRYFLPADILLLIPAAYTIYHLLYEKTYSNSLYHRFKSYFK